MINEALSTLWDCNSPNVNLVGFFWSDPELSFWLLAMFSCMSELKFRELSTAIIFGEVMGDTVFKSLESSKVFTLVLLQLNKEPSFSLSPVPLSYQAMICKWRYIFFLSFFLLSFKFFSFTFAVYFYQQTGALHANLHWFATCFTALLTIG